MINFSCDPNFQQHVGSVEVQGTNPRMTPNAPVRSRATDNGKRGFSAIDRAITLDRRGDRYVGLVLESMNASSGPKIVSTLDFSASDLASGIDAAGGGRVVMLIPGNQATCRVISAPDALGEEAVASLDLACEADFGDVVLAHRRSAGVLPGCLNSLAILACWPIEQLDSASVQQLTDPASAQTDAARDAILQSAACVPVVAALAAIVAPSGWGIAYDRQAGWIVGIGTRGEVPIIRCFIEDGDDATAWNAAIQRVQRLVIDEATQPNTAESRAWAETSTGRSVLLDSLSRDQLINRGIARATDSSWLAQHALALGAAIVASSPDIRVRSIASLRLSVPKVILPVLVRLARWFAKPRNAIATIIVSVLLITLAPIGLASARQALLTNKTTGLDAGRGEREQLITQALMYNEIEQMRWPMTKLLSDLSRATPVGIEVDSLRIGPDTGVSVQGSATKMELVNQLESNLSASGVFSSVKVNRTSATDKGVEFDVTALVRAPNFAAKLAEDFAKNPIQMREGFVMPVAPAISTRAARGIGTTGSNNGSSSSASSTVGSGNSSGNSSNRVGSNEASRRPVADNNDLPPELTDEKIAQMPRSEAVNEFAKRRKYLSLNPNADGSTRQRLESEISKLRARMDELAKVSK